MTKRKRNTQGTGVGRNMGGAKRYQDIEKSKKESLGRNALGRKEDFNSVPWPKWKDQMRDKYGRWM